MVPVTGLPFFTTRHVMGRPERPLDPAGSPLERFAVDLRAARERAGRPTYRAMARIAHRSQTTLSEAAGGRTLPTWETVTGFLHACGVTDLDNWKDKWTACGAEPDVVPADAPAAETLRRRSYWKLAAAIAVTVITTGVVIAVLEPSGTPSPVAARPPILSVADGADPEDSGCANDSGVVTVDAREVDVDQTPVGVVELRYSPRCGVSWPRFTPADPRYATITRPGPVTVHLMVVPDQDRAGGVAFSQRYVGLPVFGNVIGSTRNCVRAQAYLTGPGWRSTTGVTACYRGTVPPGG